MSLEPSLGPAEPGFPHATSTPRAPRRRYTVLAVLAHPDDEALACGGTLARIADAGGRVVLACASRGELGSCSDAGLLVDVDGDLGSARAGELERSAAILGVETVVQLDHPDGCLRWEEGLDGEIASLLAEHRPDAVLTFDSDGLYWHEDHIGVHERATAVLAAVGEHVPSLYCVQLPHGAIRALAEASHAKGGPPPDRSLWGISPDAFGVDAPPPDFRVDVRDLAERKLAAIRAHRTQAGPATLFHWIDAADVERWLGFELFRRAGRPRGGGDAGPLEPLAEPLSAADQADLKGG